LSAEIPPGGGKPPFRTRAGRLLGRLGLRGAVRAVESRLRRSAFEPATSGGVTAGAVEQALALAVERGAAANGDYYEFGVYKGATFLHAQRAADWLGIEGMRFWGFDSFRGLPPVAGPDDYRGDFAESQFAADRAWVERRLWEQGFDWDRGKLVEGFYDEILTPDLRSRLGMRPAAVALVDCDLYASTVPVLGFLRGLLGPETILLFDDWNAFDSDPDRGERRAFGEFLETNPKIEAEPLYAFGAYGQAFRVTVRALHSLFVPLFTEPLVTALALV
jgi:hypothetical protein